MAAPNQWLRPDQVGELLNMSARSIYRLLVQGHLVGFRTGGTGSAIRIRKSSVDAYIDRQIAAFQLAEGIFSDNSDNGSELYSEK